MEITIEEKLRLLQKMREDAGSNQNALQVRSQILGQPYYRYDETEHIPDTTGNTSFKIRLCCSVLLFAGYLVLQYSGLSIGGVSAEHMVNVITETSDTNLFDFSAVLPYTLEE